MDSESAACITGILTGETLELSNGQLVRQFENLGHNCEFGYVQRQCGEEPISLFRFTQSRIGSLVSALNNDLRDVGGEANTELFVPHWEPPAQQEYRVRIKKYDFIYHTRTLVGQTNISFEQLRTFELTRIEFTKRKLLEELSFGSKIFIRQGRDSATEEKILPLYNVLRKKGPNTLLWVVEKDSGRPYGTVEVMKPGLFKGYIERFAAADKAYWNLRETWLEMCRSAYALRQQNACPGTIIYGGKGV